VIDFDFTETQEDVRGLAEQIFAGHATVERVKAIESGEERFDRDLWRALADANLLGIALPEADGGSGLGLIELCAVLEQQGRTVAPVPLWETVVLGALPIAEFGSAEQRAKWLPGVVAGEVVLSSALAEAGASDPFRPAVTATEEDGGWRLDGFKPAVPAGHVAAAVLVPARTDDGVAVFIVETTADGVWRETATTTNRSKVAHLSFAAAPADRLGGEEVLTWALERALLGLCAVQVGVAEAALRLAADYTSTREQFGKPLSTFQGVALKAADAYIDTEAMRVTLWQAAWRMAEGMDATQEVLVAKWWASEGGQRVVHITQHLHGGMGADVDYPVHRYFLWGKQIEDTLGGASQQLSRLGKRIAEARS
jgi:acyl-CoA dehydrogenase